MGRLKRSEQIQRRGERTKPELELNRGAVRLFYKVLGTKDPKAIADDIFSIILAEFEWNSYGRTCGANSRAWNGLSTSRRHPNRAWSSEGNRGARLR